MRLDPPFQQYLEGEKPSHSSLPNLHRFIKAWSQDDIVDMLRHSGFVDENTKTLKKALTTGVADICEQKILWNLFEVKKALIAQNQIEIQRRATEEAARQKKISREPRWVDLHTIGTYFGVSNIVVGKWLDQLGLRETPTLEKNSSGSVDMLDVANQAKKKQAQGFIGKQPTEKALEMGVAQSLQVMNHKKKEITIYKWNLDLCKSLLVKAGHPLDTERKTLLKGKGKNGDVSVLTADDKAEQLVAEFKKAIKNGKTKYRALSVFDKQPKVILLKCEKLLNKPGFLTKRPSPFR